MVIKGGEGGGGTISTQARQPIGNLTCLDIDEQVGDEVGHMVAEVGEGHQGGLAG